MRSSEHLRAKAELLRLERGLMQPGETVLVAVSGGADSMCLLHLLWAQAETWGIRVEAAHYNHHLRGADAQRDEDFVRNWCASREIPLHCGGGDVAEEARRQGQGIEETARQMRYAFLRQTAAELGGAVIATAHNADDNAETLLLHLIRGTGLGGLTGISPNRDGLIRPFLRVTRQEIEEYDRENGVPHVEDDTNEDIRYRRNFLRHRVMPLLKGENPSLTESLTRTAIALEEDAQLLDALAERAMGEMIWDGETASLPREALFRQPAALQMRMVQQLAQKVSAQVVLTRIQRQSVVALARAEDPSGQVYLPGGLIAQRRYERLCMTVQAELSPPEPVTLHLPGTIFWGNRILSVTRETYNGQCQHRDDFYVSCDLGDWMTIRSRQTGDSLSPLGRPNKTLKKWMIDEHIPSREREQIPVLVWGKNIGGVLGLGVAECSHPRPGEAAWHCQQTFSNNINERE